MFISKRLQQGLSLIEASMVLALSAIVVSGVGFYYKSASENANANTVMTTVMNIIATANKLYPGHGRVKDYDGLDTSMIHKAIPDLELNANGDIIQPGGITIKVTSGWEGVGYLYRIDVQHIPKSQCENYSTMLTNVGGNLLKGWVKGSDQGDGSWYPFDGSPDEIKKNLFHACWSTRPYVDLMIALDT
ncbi:pilus assembly FimT family protein [Escherichia coli]|uniref:pilus assembly FimT family protein n=1 Tax=Escherichia coli TaxID=562 RepID=UPI001E5069F1|nr:hypothetical protein [Escherichia coli]